MGIFNFNRKSIELTNEKVNDEALGAESFSGWRYDLPNNANLPVVLNQTQRSGMIPFGYTGSDMLFPQLIEQSIYESSPSHPACIKFAVQTVIGAGYEFVGYDNLSIKEKDKIIKFEKANNLKKLLKEITTDFRLYNRINIKVTKHNNGTIKFERVSPARIGYNLDKSKFYYSRDFGSAGSSVIYDKYINGCEPGIYMLEFDGSVDKYEPYPAPEWVSGFKHININAKIPSFHEANMANSINPNLVILKPNTFKDITEKRNWFKDLFNQKGVQKTAGTLVFSANGKEQLPEIQQLVANPNDKLFKELRESSIDDICMAHNINPVLIGVSTPGALGANQEALLAYDVFYSIVATGMIEHIEDTIEQLLYISAISTKFELVPNHILNIPESTGTTETSMNTTKSSGRVKRDKIEETMTDEEPKTNDALKGLSTSENADIYRIIRDHGKGKLNDAIAVMRLQSYGISEEQAKEILGIL